MEGPDALVLVGFPGLGDQPLVLVGGAPLENDEPLEQGAAADAARRCQLGTRFVRSACGHQLSSRCQKNPSSSRSGSIPKPGSGTRAASRPAASSADRKCW